MTPKYPYSNHNESVAWIAGFQCGHGARDGEVGQLREALLAQNVDTYHRDLFCCCPMQDGAAKDSDHSTACQMARKALASTQPKESK